MAKVSLYDVNRIRKSVNGRLNSACDFGNGRFGADRFFSSIDMPENLVQIQKNYIDALAMERDRIEGILRDVKIEL